MGLAEKYNVQLPIIEQVNEVLFKGKSAAECMEAQVTIRSPMPVRPLKVSHLPPITVPNLAYCPLFLFGYG